MDYKKLKAQAASKKAEADAEEKGDTATAQAIEDERKAREEAERQAKAAAEEAKRIRKEKKEAEKQAKAAKEEAEKALITQKHQKTGRPSSSAEKTFQKTIRLTEKEINFLEDLWREKKTPDLSAAVREALDAYYKI